MTFEERSKTPVGTAMMPAGRAMTPGGIPVWRMNSNMFATTPTTILFGMFTLRVGMELVSSITLVEGIAAVWVFLDDVVSGDSFFKWGLPSCERGLRWVSGIMGAAAVFYGVLGLRSARRLNISYIKHFRSFQALYMTWMMAWFVLVGMPVDISYVSVPVVEHLQRRPEEWPHGMPVVCQDVADIRVRLAV